MTDKIFCHKCNKKMTDGAGGGWEFNGYGCWYCPDCWMVGGEQKQGHGERLAVWWGENSGPGRKVKITGAGGGPGAPAYYKTTANYCMPKERLAEILASYEDLEIVTDGMKIIVKGAKPENVLITITGGGGRGE